MTTPDWLTALAEKAAKADGFAPLISHNDRLYSSV